MVAKRPNSKRNLDMALRRIGGVDEDYVRRRTLLANAIVASLMPNGAVKGGTAIKIRFGDDSTRASTDLDAARSSGLDEFVRLFEDALIRGWCGFHGRVVSLPPAQPRNVPQGYVMQPFDVKLSYLGSSWCTVSLELGFNEIGDADKPDLIEPVDANVILNCLGFPSLDPIPVMPLHYQVAQKLHAVSEAGSKRAHDLIDLQVIVGSGSIDYEITRKTCERLFAYRGLQSWPPLIVEGDDWDELYAAQASSAHVLPTAGKAVDWANELVRRIAEA